MEPTEKKILIVLGVDGSCKITTEGVPSMQELIGILEIVKGMKINETLGIRPYPQLAESCGDAVRVSPIIMPKKKGIME